MKRDEAEAIFNAGGHGGQCCVCTANLANQPFTLMTRGEEEAELLCTGCDYARMVADFRRTGIFTGSTLATRSLLKKDWSVYSKFFELEVQAAPVFAAVWAKYRGHQAMVHPNLKGHLDIDLSEGKLHERDWSSAKSVVPKGHWLLEVYDSMCGYRGMQISRGGEGEGMWLSGKVRPGRHAMGWYESCHADRAFIDEALGHLRAHVGLPTGYVRDEEFPIIHPPPSHYVSIETWGEPETVLVDKAWTHAEDCVRRHLLRSYGMDGYYSDLNGKAS